MSYKGKRRLYIVLPLISIAVSIAAEVLYWSDPNPPGYQGLGFSAIMLRLLFTEISYGNRQVLLFALNDVLFLIPGLLLISGQMREDLTDTGIYTMTREKTRLHWFGKICLRILGYLALYLGSYFSSLGIMIMIKSRPTFQWVDLFWSLSYCFLLILMLYGFALLMNVLAVKWGTAISFVLVLAAFTLLMMSRIQVTSGYDSLNIWHQLDNRLNPLSVFAFDFKLSPASYLKPLVYAGLAIVVSAYGVTRMDIALRDAEKEG